MKLGRRLPLELQEQIIDASLLGDEDAAATQAHFQNLRLVGKAVRLRVHRSHPLGVAELAGQFAALLLDRTPPSYFGEKLLEGQSILGEAKTLSLRRTTRQASGVSWGTAYDDPMWTCGVMSMLKITMSLEELDVAVGGHPVSLRPLFAAAPSTLRLVDMWDCSTDDALRDLDLTSFKFLRHFFFSARPNSNSSRPLNLSLPVTLVGLALRNVPLTVEDVNTLNLPRFRELEEILIDAGGLRSSGVVALRLDQLPKLRSVNLWDNRVDDQALRELARCEGLEELDLGLNQLQSITDLRLSANTSIKTLNVHSFDANDPACLGLVTNRTLLDITATQHFFTSFLFGLEVNRTLRRLDLSYSDHAYHNPLIGTADRFRELSSQLAHNSTLQYIGLRKCGLGNESVRELVLAGTSGLKELDLSQNSDLSDDGVTPLLESIEQHGLAVSVDLAQTTVGEELLERFRTAMAF